MFGAEFASQTAGVLERLDDVLDELRELDLCAGSDAELLEVLAGVERRVRRFATVDHALVAETEARGLSLQHGCANTTAFVTRLLGIGSGQAALRVRAARQLSPRRALSGEVLAAQFPATAAAQAEGSARFTRRGRLEFALTTDCRNGVGTDRLPRGVPWPDVAAVSSSVRSGQWVLVAGRADRIRHR